MSSDSAVDAVTIEMYLHNNESDYKELLAHIVPGLFLVTSGSLMNFYSLYVFDIELSSKCLI
jgi:hypothetical protein